MGFFDFLFGKSKEESSTLQALSPIEQVVKESVEHLKKTVGTLTSEKLEAEAINLASYIFLREGGKIQFELDFLTKGLIEKIPSGDYAVSDKVFPFMVKYGDGLYTNNHADFGKNMGYKLNVTKDPEFANFLKGYYGSVHKVNVGEVKPQPNSSKHNNAQNDRVDLGLPSGILWATCNIGAASPTETGEYVAWGEKESKGVYGWETYKLCRGSYSSIIKYTNTDGKSILDSQDDIATSKLGGEWRIPTKEEMEELVEECKWEWKNQNGMSGWKVTGKNGNSIFLPAAGAASAYRIAGVNELGRYWTATRDESDYSAFNLRFNNGRGTIAVVDDTRFYGRSVRPVFGAKKEMPIKTNTVQHLKEPNKIAKNNELNLICDLAVRQLMETMSQSKIYRILEISIIELSNGGLRIRQELNGSVYNDFDFLGYNGWIKYIRIYGKELNGHCQTIGDSMEIFGMKVDNIYHRGDYVECLINQAQFGV